jgi:long-subunit acyl-CoA synthetase (AMP-forming)
MFDPKTNIWSGRKIPSLYHEEATYGEIVLHYLSRSPNDVIQVCEEDGIELTCEQLRTYSIRVAENLSKFNISHGHVAGFVAQNTTYLAPVILGCLLQGVTFATIDPILNKDNIKHLFKDSKPNIVFCDHDLFDKTECGLRELGNRSKIISLTEKIGKSGVHHVSELLQETGTENDFV